MKPEPSSTQRTVLIVDDEDVIRELIADVLSESGYRVLAAANGAQAVECVRRERGGIDLVVLDMLMPDMDGRRTYELMREIEPDLRVLISTGFGRDDHTRSLLERGVRGIVAKPFHVEDLLAHIRTHVRT